MKPLIFLSSILFIVSSVNAQNTTSEVSTAFKPPIDSLETIANKLADLAVQNIGSGVEVANANAALYNWKAQQYLILDMLRFSFNLNEFTIHGREALTNANGGNSLVYPRYNIGLTIPVGTVITHSKQTKVEYYKYQAELEKLKRQKENYRLQVITSYYNYNKVLQLLSLEEEALQDAEFAYKKTEEKFEKGEVTLEVYTVTSKRFNSEKVTKAGLETDLRVAKAELEALMGMPLSKAYTMIGSKKTK